MRASLIAILLFGLLAGTSIAIDAVPASASLVTQKYAFDKSSLLQTAIRPGRGYFIDNRKKDRKKKKSCTPNLPRISCHGREGIFFQQNGGSINKVNNPNTVTPLPVPTGDTLNIAVCNLDNLEFNTGSLANLIRPLVSTVGDNADVRIVIEHSANLLVNDQYTLPSGSVINTLIQGLIGENVNIEVDIIGSANIHLADDKATATLTGSNLIATIIDGFTSNVDANGDDLCLTGCMKVNIQDSANIAGKRKQNDVTLNAGAALENGAIRARCLENAHVEVNKRNVATIYGARDVTIDNSALSVDNVGSTGATRFSSINMHLDNFGTVSAKGNVIVRNGGFLIDSAVDLNIAGTVVGSTIHVDGHRVGTVKTKDLLVDGTGGSALVSDFVLVGTTRGGTVISVDVDRLGDVLAHGAVTLTNAAELVRDVIQFDTATNTEIILHGTTIGSVYADDLTLDVAGTSLVESLLNFANCNMGCEYDIHLFDVGNTEVTDTVTLGPGTALIEEFIEATGGVSPVVNAEDLILQVKNAGNVLCPGGRRRHAQLEIDANANLISAVIRALGANLGGWTAQEFAIVLHFLANVQVLNNQDDNFDFFDEDANVLVVNGGDLTPADAMLQLTESETGDFTRCIRPPRNPKSKEKGRKNERKGGNKNRRNKNRRNNKRRNKKRHNGPK